MTKLTNMNYDGNGNVREHIMKLTDIASKLKSLDVVISDSFLVQLAISSLPKEFGQLKVTYNSSREKWSLNELISICAQEEERLKREKGETVNFVNHGNGNQASKNFKKSGKKNKKPFQPNAGGEKKGLGPEPAKFKERRCFFCKKKGHMKKECHKYKA